MSLADDLNKLDHPAFRAWLERALRGREALPLLAPDESPYLGIVRLDHTELKGPARESLYTGAIELLQRFCLAGDADEAYGRQVIQLATRFAPAEASAVLAGVAAHFAAAPHFKGPMQLEILSALVDAHPPQPAEFWQARLQEDPERFGLLALSGVLATNPAQALQLLASLPPTVENGEDATLKLDLTWDSLEPPQRARFVQQVEAALHACAPALAGPIADWVKSKQEEAPLLAPSKLRNILDKLLGTEAAPRHLSPKLVDSEESYCSPTDGSKLAA